MSHNSVGFTQVALNLLRFHLIWPKHGEPISVRFILKILLFYSIPGVQVVLSILHLFITVYYNRNATITDDMVLLFESVFVIYEFLIYIMNINRILEYVDELQQFERFGKPVDLEKFTKSHDRRLKMLYYYCFVSVIFCAIFEYSTTPFCERRNAMAGTENLCGFLVNYWLPFNWDQLYGIKLFMHVYQVVAVLIVILPQITQTYFGVILIDSLTLRLEEVRKAFNQITQLDTMQMKQQQIKHAIEYHIDTIRLIDGFNDCLGKFSAVHFCLSSIIIGILNYQILQDVQLKGVFHLLGWFSSLALLSNAGQNLIDKSLQISEELYDLEWFDMDDGLKSTIKFLIQRSQNQLSISSGIFYCYSHELLHMLMEASYSYMTILSHIYKK